MSKRISAVVKRMLDQVESRVSAEARLLVAPMLDAVGAEDLTELTPDELARSVELVTGLLKHRVKRLPIVDIENADTDSGTARSLMTVVSRDKPFLFSSIMAELNAHGVDVVMAAHPVLTLEESESGLALSAPNLPGKTHKISIIHVVLDDLKKDNTADLQAGLNRVINHVSHATEDWPSMVDRLNEIVAEWRDGVLPAKRGDVNEAIGFLEWLRDDNFVLLGMREFDFSGGEKRGKLVRADKQPLGILRDENLRVLIHDGQPVTTTPQVREFLTGRNLLLVAKANSKSIVHRRTYLDYIGIKLFDGKGKVLGELRLVGLFTQTAYTRSIFEVPFIRSKATSVIDRFDFEAGGHAAKALINVLETYPRDELFQIDVPQLARNCEAIIALEQRPRVRVLSRIDPFDRFVSVLVYVARDKYTSGLRAKIGMLLASEFDGHVSAFYPAFFENGITRVHFIIGRSKGQTPKPSPASLEDAIDKITKSWEDQLFDFISTQGDIADAPMLDDFEFTAGYKQTVAAPRAFRDLSYFGKVSSENPLAVDFYRDAGESENEASLRVFHRGEPVILSKRVPLLENLGLQVVRENTYCVNHSGKPIWLHDMQLRSRDGSAVPLDDDGQLFETAFTSVWSGAVDNDPFNALILKAGLSCQQTSIIRAIGRYLKQAGSQFSQAYMAATLSANVEFTKRLFELFQLRFNPASNVLYADANERHSVSKLIEKKLDALLLKVESIDEDKILRNFKAVLDAMLRTNYFALATSAADAALSFKLDPKKLDFLPEPRPYREIFVYDTRVEGVHLRFGPVARGGLRWSDRAEDYRTEVLGLVKAQQVKNAVIVPVGAKGGFFPKQLPTNATRDEFNEAGRQAYIIFISSLLSLTDNIEGEEKISPPDVICHDDPDPYLVVAADKGTATFSDTANGIAQERGFWLDDAFASGGSAGYDHKAMGITARGAWEAVKRHFREMDKDIQTEPFTVVGVGDMSGDVFGNGMLLSNQIKLIAAFNHRNIFIDPDPDPAKSFEERKRLFAMGRSTWQDYDPKALSKGGGIFPRDQKSITLSKAAAAAIGLTKTKVSPTEVMQAILKAEAELMWFGGIGTYIRASHETDAEVGDRANDPIRINAKQVRAKVIGEGANLGLTQHARIEFGKLGGRCNSDAIDNSGGVNSSDVEVNIKIAFAPALRDNRLTRAARNKLLVQMTDEVADLVLRNNYAQTLTISRTQNAGIQNLALQAQLMKSLESRNLLDRGVEMLPSDEEIAERLADQKGLTRAEVGVLLSYAKIVLFDDLVQSGLPDDPYLEEDLLGYFPSKMHTAFRENIAAHRLRREIIATVIANELINRGGPSVISRFEDASGALPFEIAHAHVIVRDAYGIPEIEKAIDALDNKISGSKQLELYEELANANRVAISRYLKDGNSAKSLRDEIEKLSSAFTVMKSRAKGFLPEYLLSWSENRKRAFAAAGMEKSAAASLGLLPILASAPAILTIAEEAAQPLEIEQAAAAYHAITKAFRLGRLEHLAQMIDVTDYFDGLAQTRALSAIDSAHVAMTRAALGQAETGEADMTELVNAWVDENSDRIAAVQKRIATIMETSSELSVSRLTVAAGLLSDLV